MAIWAGHGDQTRQRLVHLVHPTAGSKGKWSKIELDLFFILISGFDVQEESAAPEYCHVPIKY